MVDALSLRFITVVNPELNPFTPAPGCSSSSSILRFFADLEALFGRANVTDEADMKRHATYYSHAQVEYIWKGLEAYDDASKTYVEFRDAVTALYGYKALKHEFVQMHCLHSSQRHYSGCSSPRC